MRGLTAVALLLLVAACQAPPPAEMTEAERAQYEAEVRQEITSMVDSYKDALLTRDAEAFMSAYASDVRVYDPGMNFDRDELQAFIEEAFQTMTWTEFEATLKELFVHGDVAYGIVEVSETFQMEGQEPETNILNCFNRFVKEGGALKVDREVCGRRDAPAEG